MTTGRAWLGLVGAGIAGSLGVAASVVTILQYLQTPIAQPAPHVAPTVVTEAAVPTVVKPQEAKVAPVQQNDVGGQDAVIHLQSQSLALEQKPVTMAAEPTQATCISGAWGESIQPIEIKVGMEVCDSSNRILATVASIETQGYLGGNIAFEAPGESQQLKCYKMRSCEFPWARNVEFVIERFTEDFGERAAFLRSKSATPPPLANAPACLGSAWVKATQPIEITVGMEVCDSAGRILASVGWIETQGYFGGSIAFIAPGSSQPFKCYKMKSCEFPWARGKQFVIDRFTEDFGKSVALLRLK